MFNKLKIHCNWFDIRYLFGCSKQRRSSPLIDLCNNPIINGAMLLNDRIYIFRETNFYVFDGKSDEHSVFGNLVEGPTEASFTYKGFDAGG